MKKLMNSIPTPPFWLIEVILIAWILLIILW